MGFGIILGLENTSGSSASEMAKTRTSAAPYGTSVRKHNLGGFTKLLTLHSLSCNSLSEYSLQENLGSFFSRTGVAGVVLKSCAAAYICRDSGLRCAS